jgi:precorrin-6A/cobalt-precorrin-6A reductase
VKFLQSRGPFSAEEELGLLREERIDLLVSKNSGGDATYAKIEAARCLGLPVIMIERPPLPDCICFSEIEELMTHLGF